MMWDGKNPTRIRISKEIAEECYFCPWDFCGVRLDLAFWTFEVVISKSLRGHYHDLFWGLLWFVSWESEGAPQRHRAQEIWALSGDD